MAKDWEDMDRMDPDWMDTGWETAQVNKSSARKRESGRNISNKDWQKREGSDRGRSNIGKTAKTGTNRSRPDKNRTDRLSREQRRKKRKQKRIIITAVVALLAVGLAIVIFMSVLRVRTLRAFSGEYTRTLDVTDSIVANVAVWLKDVEGADVTADWISGRTDPLTVTVSLRFDPQGLKKGSFSEELDDQSYSECTDKAYELTAECLRELIVKRLIMVGYAESVSDEEADALITEALGMPLDSYIKDSGVIIMPGYDELAQGQTGLGDYKISGMTIEWTRNGEERADEFKTAGDTLIIVDRGCIYERTQ